MLFDGVGSFPRHNMLIRGAGGVNDLLFDVRADIEGESALIFENNLRSAVYDGVRPVLPENAPCAGWYVALMNTCWTTDPEGRPDFNAVSQEMTRHAHFFHGKIEAR